MEWTLHVWRELVGSVHFGARGTVRADQIMREARLQRRRVSKGENAYVAGQVRDERDVQQTVGGQLVRQTVEHRLV
ncbi:hypothetical protein, partial [Burkholderia cenocepacia]|uniref:hypothetical protein n=1 Tax=Burkholderia cenocepacia TaxID=95486 RepID=UPI00406C278D